ncbi:hypothetical protein FB451DRAFT_166474 [Mycena latifolia]|nr:hypothetical protein FB451DRAFT_166474 [Mycena latifolia]
MSESIAGDIPVPLVGIVSLWVPTVLYGINIVMFIICVTILLKKRTRGDRVPWYLLGGICLQFLLCTAHVAAAFGAGIHAFNTVTTTPADLVDSWTTPLGTYTALQQVLYAINNFIGDLILIWRLYVVYGNNWYITILPLLLALASEACTLYSSLSTFIDPEMILLRELAGRNHPNALTNLVTAGFSMTAATQLLVTTLLAVRIYTATLSIRQLSKKPESVYTGVMWMLVESGAALAAAEIVFLGVWRNSLSGVSQLTLAVLGQLCALIPLSIVTRVGLRLAFNGTTQNHSGGPLQFAHDPSDPSNTKGTLELSGLNTSGSVYSRGGQGEFSTAV